MIWTDTTIQSEVLPHSWTPGRSQADAHHVFIYDSVAFCIGEVVVEEHALLHRSGRPSSNLLDLLNVKPRNPDSFIVNLPAGKHTPRQIPRVQSMTIYCWDRIFRFWRLFRE